MKAGTVSVSFITPPPKATCHIKVHTEYVLNQSLLSPASALLGMHGRALPKLEQRIYGQRTWRAGCAKEGVCGLMAGLGQVEHF